MRHPAPAIVLAQLFGTLLWFSANSAADLGTLTNAVQLGFIVGTLSFAISGLADRFAASRIFAVCAVVGSALAFQNAVGFAITMGSIYLGSAWIGAWQSHIAWLLLPGPLLGLLGLSPLWRRRPG